MQPYVAIKNNNNNLRKRERPLQRTKFKVKAKPANRSDKWTSKS